MLSDEYFSMAEEASAKLYAKHYANLRRLNDSENHAEVRYEEGFLEALGLMFDTFFTGRTVYLIKSLAESVYEERKGEGSL